MSFRYDLTAIEILRLLGYTEPVGEAALLKAEQEKNLKLPPALFEFWSLAADSPLFKTRAGPVPASRSGGPRARTEQRSAEDGPPGPPSQRATSPPLWNRSHI